MRDISNNNFGDAEMRNIHFGEREAVLTLFCPQELLFAKITLSDVIMLTMSTNHMQNVVEGIYVADEMVDMENESIKNALQKASLDGLDAYKNIFIIYVCGIAGPDLVAICKKFAVETEMYL